MVGVTIVFRVMDWVAAITTAERGATIELIGEPAEIEAAARAEADRRGLAIEITHIDGAIVGINRSNPSAAEQ